MQDYNQVVSKEQIEKIRRLGDFEITMLISEIHDHGWPMAAKTLTIMPVEDADAHNPGT
jgi:hypothetical protein